MLLPVNILSFNEILDKPEVYGQNYSFLADPMLTRLITYYSYDCARSNRRMKVKEDGTFKFIRTVSARDTVIPCKLLNKDVVTTTNIHTKLVDDQSNPVPKSNLDKDQLFIRYDNRLYSVGFPGKYIEGSTETKLLNETPIVVKRPDRKARKDFKVLIADIKREAKALDILGAIPSDEELELLRNITTNRKQDTFCTTKDCNANVLLVLALRDNFMQKLPQEFREHRYEIQANLGCILKDIETNLNATEDSITEYLEIV